MGPPVHCEAMRGNEGLTWAWEKVLHYLSGGECKTDPRTGVKNRVRVSTGRSRREIGARMKFKRFKNSKGLKDFKDQLWDEGAVGGREGGRVEKRRRPRSEVSRRRGSRAVGTVCGKRLISVCA